MKHILITGCSTGIGYATAHYLHQKGHQVIASCRAQEDVIQLQNEGLTCIQLDLNNEESIQQGFQKALELSNHRLDTLFNNGAYGQAGAIEDLPLQALRDQFESNFFGWHTLTQLAILHMLKQNKGLIIQNSSVLGLVAMQYRGAYIASKFAIEGYTDTLRLELSNTPISISLIEPGPIETQFRQTAKRTFHQWITPTQSRHHQNYEQTLARLSRKSGDTKVTLPAQAVANLVEKILHTPNPKPRYYITKPTHLFGILKRLLPAALLDKILKGYY